MSWFKDRVEDAGGFVKDRVEDGKDLVGDAAALPGKFFTKAQNFGLPSGNDGGSSAWESWGHAEIRSMLDDSVSVQDIDAYERAWQQKSQQVAEIVANRVRSIAAVVAEGWQGESAAAAVAALGPIERWSAQLVQETGNAGQFIQQAGTSAETADRTVPPAPEISSGGGLFRGVMMSAPVIGPVAGVVSGADLVMGNAEAKAAHAQAVAIMNGTYSGGINPARSSLPPDFTPGPDPTLQAPGPSLTGGGGFGGGGAGGFGGAGGGAGEFTPPAVSTTAQSFTPSEYRAPSGTPVAPAATAGPDPGATARGGTPVGPAAFTPGAGGVGTAGGGAGRGGAGVRGGLGGGGSGGGSAPGGPGRAPSGSPAAGAGPGAAGGLGAAARTGGAAAGRGGMPMGGMAGGGRGHGDDDLEHKNSFLAPPDDEVDPLVGELPPALPAGGVIGRPPWQEEQREHRP